MLRNYIMLILLIVGVSPLAASSAEWGIRYGAGLSSVYGDEADYELRYDLKRVTNVTDDWGYLRIRSSETQSDLAQNFGVYGAFQLSKGTDSFWFQPELLWQRFTFAYDYRGNVLETDNVLLATEFADTLKGHIDKTLDYVTLPLLFKMRQELTPEQLQGTYQGAYICFGPSVSVVLSNQSTKHGGIKALERKIEDYVQDQSDPATTYTSQAVKSGSDEVIDYKVDFILGFGIGIKDIFRMGIGSDEFILDLRITAGINPLGDAPSRKAFNLRSVIFSLGYKL